MTQKQIEKMVSALRVIHTWATFEGGRVLNPKDVAKLTAEALKEAAACKPKTLLALAACPFCGGKAKRGRKAIGFDTIADVVSCGATRCPVSPETTPCDHRGMLRGKHGATKVWNHRPNDLAQQPRGESAAPKTH